MEYSSKPKNKFVKCNTCSIAERKKMSREHPHFLLLISFIFYLLIIFFTTGVLDLVTISPQIDKSIANLLYLFC